jgi:hypothetical protein
LGSYGAELIMSADDSKLSFLLLLGVGRLQRKVNPYRCSAPRCTLHHDMYYRTFPLCSRHWNKHCDAERAAEERAYKDSLSPPTCPATAAADGAGIDASAGGALPPVAPVPPVCSTLAALFLTLMGAAGCAPTQAEAAPLPRSTPSAQREKSPRVPAAPRVDHHVLLAAFEQIESGGREQVFGDGGRSWGIFQFGRARWRECGGDPAQWGKASAAEQRRVMRTAILRYLADAPDGLDAKIIHAAREHNGLGSASKAYSRRLLQVYKTLRQAEEE